MTTSSTSNTVSSGSATEPKEKLREEATEATKTIKDESDALASKAKMAGKAQADEQFERGKSVVDEQLGSLSSAVDDAADRLREDDHPLASYATELSTQVNNLSSSIQDSSLDEVAGKAYRLARENPGAFAIGSVALGFVISRFVKASDSRRNLERDRYTGPDSDSESGRSDLRAGLAGSASTSSAGSRAHTSVSSGSSAGVVSAERPDVALPVGDRSDNTIATMNRSV